MAYINYRDVASILVDTSTIGADSDFFCL